MTSAYDRKLHPVAPVSYIHVEDFPRSEKIP